MNHQGRHLFFIALFCLMTGFSAVLWGEELRKIGITTVQQDFGQDPGWEGMNNRVMADSCPTIAQNFGWSNTGRISNASGEIGGVIWRSGIPAYYAMPLGPFSFKDSLSASGKIAVIAPPDEGVGFYIGFFNNERQGWRVWSSCGFRIGEVKNGRARFFLDYKTGRAKGAILNPDIEIPCDGSVHTWELCYDPHATVGDNWPDPHMPLYMSGVNNMREEDILRRARKIDPDITLQRLQELLLRARDAGLVDDWYRKGSYHLWTYEEEADLLKGRITFRFDDAPAVSYFLLPGHADEPTWINRFGVYNMQIYHGSLEFYIADLNINGQRIDLSQDPHWDGRGNRVTFVQEDFHARQNFGYCQTNWAGRAAGEIGGRFWGTEVIDPLHAFYADDIGHLTLDDPISFSGWINFVEGGVDGRMLLGYFNRDARLADIEGEYKGNPPHQFLGIEIMDQTKIGYSFTAVCSPRQDIAFEERGPTYIPDRIKRPFSFAYHPEVGEAGMVMITLGEDTLRVQLTQEQRKTGASFDRFGLLNPRKGGKYVELYFDDLSYVVRRSADVRHPRVIVRVPYPKDGRKY